MFYNKSVLFFITIFLVHTYANAMKRSLEDNTVVLPKRIKLVLEEEVPQRHRGMFYCNQYSNCTYTTKRLDKIKEHHQLHNNPDAFPCTKCDYLGATKRCVKNHDVKWHVPHQETAKQVIKKPATEQCGYCGREGSNMERHMKVYHTPRFGKRSYFECFSLYRPVPHKVLSLSNNSTVETEIE